ncbi:MAG: DUF2723 domain-containing protein [Actinomycetota bacterium]|nr:DUF2723 domain-containing protein [Actinomycetota bacterium]HZY64753.1 DUF2723 domain-containing protein [Rubrobacteraceae bacterium]
MRYGSGFIGTLFARVPGIFAGFAVALAAFILYLITLAPTVLSRVAEEGLYDAGLFQVRAYVLSISHPTGYPIYLLLAKLFTYLPVGDVAYRVNLASAVFGAAAVFFVFVVCRQITGRVLPSVAAATLLAVSQTFWEQSVIAEVYTLHALFIALCISVLLLWRNTRKDRYLLLWAFLTGLAMTNHMTSGLLLLVGLLFVRLTERGKLSDRRLRLKGAGLFALGLTPYLYLPIRSIVDPPFAAYDPDTPLKFLAFVSGIPFGQHMLAFGPVELVGRMEMYRVYLSQQFHWFFVLVAVIGLMSLFHRDRPVFTLLGLLYAGWLLYALEYNIADIWVYFVPTYLILCVLVAPGIIALIEGTRLVLSTVTLSSTLRAAPKALVFVAFLALVLPLIGTNGTYLTANYSDRYEARDTIEAIAENAEPGATVITDGSSMWYMKLVENRRTDLELVSPFLEDDLESDAEGRWLRFTKKHMTKDDKPVYIVASNGISGESLALLHEAGYQLLPREGGAFYKVVHSPKAPDVNVKHA